MSSLSYRRAALQHASTVGLVIALYDTLLGNLGRAAAAIEHSDIETRCAELTHGFKVLQQLDSMVNVRQGGQAAANLRRFYAHLRRQMLAAQFKLTPSVLRELIRAIIDVREAWQQVDANGLQQQAVATAGGSQPAEASMLYTQASQAEIAHTAFSCSV